MTEGSSRFLIIAAAWVVDASIEMIERELAQLRSACSFSPNHEFKFSRSKNAVREKFLYSLIQLPVRYKAIVVDKRNAAASLFRLQPSQLYVESIKRILYDNDPPLNGVIVVIDEATAGIHKKEYNRILKHHVSKNLVQKIRQARSQSDAMIQITDMIAGSIFRHYEKGDSHYHERLMGKEKLLIEF